MYIASTHVQSNGAAALQLVHIALRSLISKIISEVLQR